MSPVGYAHPSKAFELLESGTAAGGEAMFSGLFQQILFSLDK
jgi:hypothetical protein